VVRQCSSPGLTQPHAAQKAIAGGDTSLRGSLLKLGDKGPMKTWKRRYFLQKSEKLFYYASSNTSGDAKGFIDLIQNEFRVLPDAVFERKVCTRGVWEIESSREFKRESSREFKREFKRESSRVQERECV
jgi:PH domain